MFHAVAAELWSRVTASKTVTNRSRAKKSLQAKGSAPADEIHQAVHTSSKVEAAQKSPHAAASVGQARQLSSKGGKKRLLEEEGPTTVEKKLPCASVKSPLKRTRRARNDTQRYSNGLQDSEDAESADEGAINLKADSEPEMAATASKGEEKPSTKLDSKSKRKAREGKTGFKQIKGKGAKPSEWLPSSAENGIDDIQPRAEHLQNEKPRAPLQKRMPARPAKLSQIRQTRCDLTQACPKHDAYASEYVSLLYLPHCTSMLHAVD